MPTLVSNSRLAGADTQRTLMALDEVTIIRQLPSILTGVNSSTESPKPRSQGRRSSSQTRPGQEQKP